MWHRLLKSPGYQTQIIHSTFDVFRFWIIFTNIRNRNPRRSSLLHCSGSDIMVTSGVITSVIDFGLTMGKHSYVKDLPLPVLVPTKTSWPFITATMAFRWLSVISLILKVLQISSNIHFCLFSKSKLRSIRAILLFKNDVMETGVILLSASRHFSKLRNEN